MKKLLALDIGMVCIGVDSARALSPLNLNSPAELPPELAALIDDFECGRCAPETFFAAIGRLFPAAPRGADAERWFNAILGDETPGLAALLDKLAPEWDFVFLSDVSETHLREVARKLSFFRRAAGGVYSFKVGARKPDPAMYRAFETGYRRPDLYTDDRRVNIEAALARGWNARVFTTVDDLAQAAESLQ